MLVPRHTFLEVGVGEHGGRHKEQASLVAQADFGALSIAANAVPRVVIGADGSVSSGVFGYNVGYAHFGIAVFGVFHRKSRWLEI